MLASLVILIWLLSKFQAFHGVLISLSYISLAGTKGRVRVVLYQLTGVRLVTPGQTGLTMAMAIC